MRARRPRYKTLFFFDRTVPREIYYSVQRRLNMMGYGAVWGPRSAVARAPIEEVVAYCAARGIPIIATFDRRLTLPPGAGVRLVRLRRGRWKSVNRILAALFGELREVLSVPPSEPLDC